jgi:hypothetical protein
MAKINIAPAAREITEHFAAGEHARNYQRAMIAAHAPLFFVRMGGVPRYDDAGQPANGAAVKATAARKVRIEARDNANALRNALAKAERVAAAKRFAAANATMREETDESEYGFDDAPDCSPYSEN